MKLSSASLAAPWRAAWCAFDPNGTCAVNTNSHRADNAILELNGRDSMVELTKLGKMTLLAVGATFAFGTHSVRAGTLESIANQCQAAANFVNTDPTAKAQDWQGCLVVRCDGQRGHFVGNTLLGYQRRRLHTD